MSPYRFESRSGIAVERTTHQIDYESGIGFLTDALDGECGAFFSSGVEYPDRYSRWEFGFTQPPLEIVGRGPRLSVNALNGRGMALLEILEPLLVEDAAVAVAERGDRTIEIGIERDERRFPEEERSRQPSAFAPLRRIIRDFAGLDDGFLGFYGAFGYDLIFQFEPMPLAKPRDPEAKDLHLYLPDRLWTLDRRLQSARRHEFEFSRGALTTAGADRDSFTAVPRVKAAEDAPAGIAVDQSAEDYAAQVDAARERTIAGDVFELVLSREFSAPFGESASALFAKVREINPSPYEFFLQFGDEALVGASPEMFVRVDGERIESAPIAGTVRRGADAMEDADRVRDLLNSAKDEAELTMCTDVDRNDKARICEPGSVRLLGRRLIERYAGLFHTVDHVEGRLRPEFDGIDAFLSHMWAVTLTGAPKRMAVRLIEDMEARPRGWYGGAIGLLGLDGNINTGITIRTVRVAGGVARYRAGSSLVYDSVGAEEARETETKATSFFRALEALRGAGPAAPAAAAGPEGRHAKPAAKSPSIVMIDNEDSFVHCLADYFRQAGARVATYRWGVPVPELLELAPDVVVHSPGPGRPEQFGVPALVRDLADAGVAQFGVCLGLQGIAEAFGGELAVLPEPRHGKSWDVLHDGNGLFAGLPSPLRVGAYHSLYAVRDRLPDMLRVTARTESGLVMALEHASLPIAAVQFHPESILTLTGGVGHSLVENVLKGLRAPRRRKSAGAEEGKAGKPKRSGRRVKV